MLLRAILTGRTTSPPLLESLVVLGKARSLDRVRRFIEHQKYLVKSSRWVPAVIEALSGKGEARTVVDVLSGKDKAERAPGAHDSQKRESQAQKPKQQGS